MFEDWFFKAIITASQVIIEITTTPTSSYFSAVRSTTKLPAFYVEELRSVSFFLLLILVKVINVFVLWEYAHGKQRSGHGIAIAQPVTGKIQFQPWRVTQIRTFHVLIR